MKERAEDFFVQERPLYEPCGEGEHVYCEIQKVGMTTFQAVDRVARAVGVARGDVGYAGMKDARAVSRQVLSVRGTTPEALMGLRLADLQVLWAARHGNKLRLGHLAGNRFAVKIRGVNPTDVVKLGPVLDQIQRRGMPNYFGEQRFGRRGDNDRLGAAVVRGDAESVLRLLLGGPLPEVDDEQTQTARAAFDGGDYSASMSAWPRGAGLETRVLGRYMRSGDAASALRAVDDRVVRLWVSALQSRLFNDVVAHRIDALDRVMEGDLAWKHDSGAVFPVKDPSAEQPRCEAFDISPSGPLMGYRMTLPEGEPLAMEQLVFAEAGLAPDDFRRAGELRVKGARRPLRVRPTDVQLAAGVDDHGAHITVAFTLPAGSFATVLVRELTKADADPSAPSEDDAVPAEPSS